MTRQLKPTKVGQVSIGKHGGFLDLMFDRNKLDFFVRGGQDIVRDATAEACRGKAVVHFKNWQPEKWEGIIEVDVPGQTEYRHGREKLISIDISLKFRRLEVSTRLDGGKIERQHRLDFEAELSAAKRHGYSSAEEQRKYLTDRRNAGSDVTQRFSCSDDDISLPYTDETWAGLMAIKTMLEDANEKLNKMIKADGLEKRLLSIAAGKAPLLLGEAPKTKGKK